MALQKLETHGEEQLDLAYVKAYLRVEHNADDGLIRGFIATARHAIEAYTSRSLISQSWLFTINAGFAVARSDETYLSQSKSRGENGLELPRSPFTALESDPILETQYGETPLSDFRVDTSGRTAKVHFGSTAQSLMDGAGKISIRFRAGYETGELPESLKQAMLMIIAQLYDNRAAANDNPGLVGEFNQNVLMLLRPYQVKRIA